MITGQDIFRSLLVHASLTTDYPERQRQYYKSCALCGDSDGHVCSGCTNLLTRLTRKQKLLLHKRLKALGDKHRADILSRNFEVFATEKRETKLEKIRKQLGFTKKAMATKLGLSPAQYSPIERGEGDLSTLAKQRLERLAIGV